MKLIVNNFSVLVFLLLILLSFYFDYEYLTNLSRFYDYVGFTIDFNISKYLLYKTVLILSSFLSFIILSRSELLYSVYILVILLFLLPAGILYSFKNIGISAFLCNFLLLVTFFLLSLNDFKIRSYFLSTSITDFIIVSMAAAVFLPIFLHPSFHPNFKTLILQDIYSTRADFKENSTTLINYLTTWEIKVVAPCLFIYGLVRKKYLYSFFSFFILIYIFLISGHRSVYMALFVLVFFYFLGKDIKSKMSYFFIGLLGLLLLIVPVADYLLKQNVFHAMIINRIFFDQSLLTHYYFDFFQSKPVFFAESMFFNKFIDYPYDLPSAYLIGREYFGSAIQHANTGIIGDGFMNIGYVGVVLFTIIFSAIFVFFKSIEFDKRYFGVFFLLIFDLQNNSLLSTFFSGGLWILILFSLTIMKVKPEE